MPNAPDPLQELRDVHLPDPISWWPPAFGWWMLLVAVLIGVGLVLGIRAYRRRTRPRRLAIAQLKEVKQQYTAGSDEQQTITRLSDIVRRVALAVFPRSHVAGLSGQSWLQFLDRTGHTTQFSDGPGQCLLSGPYQPHVTASAADVIPLIERWIQQVDMPSRKSLR
jgi:hypothetical protein